MKKLSLRKKFWLGSGSILLIMLVVAAIGFRATLVQDGLVHTVQFNVHKQELTSAIELAVEKEKVGGRDALLNNSTQYLLAGREEFRKQMVVLEPILTSPTSHELFARIREANTAYCGIVDQALALHRSGDNTAALELFYGAQAQQTRADLKKSTEDLVQWYGKLATDAEAEQVASSRTTSILILVVSIVGVLCGVTVAVFLIRTVVASITPIVEVMDAIAHHDLRVPDVEVTSQDELGQAATAVNTMKTNLTEMVHRITESSEQLAAATEEIAQGAKQTSVSAHEEAAQAFQVASAMQEMSATVGEVTGHAQKASDASTQSAKAARDGGAVADQTLAAMTSIADSTSRAAERILELGKSSEKIGNIVAVITEIAGQTNLLALNAAIEAARAGEQGRGFAVVAGEVRRLAERTGQATQEISSMIETIQSETKVAVDAIEKGNLEVERGVQKTQESHRALTEIIERSVEVGEMVAQIATAATQQQGAVQQIDTSISQISSSTQASSVNADQTADACTSLSQLAAELQRLVNQFHVEDQKTMSHSFTGNANSPKGSYRAARA